jgi:GntR family transcriptional regulator
MKKLIKAPVYQQLNQLLRDLIRDGEFQVGDQFLTERQIGDRFGVSRGTANKALSNLVSEGILAFKKGVGTFVRDNVLDYDLRSLVSFTDKALAAGKKPATTILAYKLQPVNQAAVDLASTLNLNSNDNVYYIERLRLADGRPVILERRYVVARFCSGLTERDLTGSLYTTWVEKCKLDIIGADQTVRAVTLSGSEAQLMGVVEGAAGLLVTSVGYLREETPLWWERTLYRGDAYEFRNRLGPIRAGYPAAGALVDI